MCSGIYQTSKNEIENTKLILQISYQRCDQIVNINNQSVGITTAICIGLISFLGTAYFTSANPFRFYTIIIAIQIMCVVLIIWRYYAHILDDDVTQAYKKILDCEYRLNIIPALSLLNSLEKRIKINMNQKYMRQKLETRYQIIQALIDRHRIGYRYHNFLDNIAICVVVIAFCIQYLFIVRNNYQLGLIYFYSYVVVIPILYSVFLWGLKQDISQRFPIQRDPSDGDIDSVFSELHIFKEA